MPSINAVFAFNCSLLPFSFSCSHWLYFDSQDLQSRSNFYLPLCTYLLAEHEETRTVKDTCFSFIRHSSSLAILRVCHAWRASVAPQPGCLALVKITAGRWRHKQVTRLSSKVVFSRGYKLSFKSKVV